MSHEAGTPVGTLLPRRAEQAISASLLDTRVVLVTGARQCGKSTLVRMVAGERSAEWRNLDSAADRLAAESDPEGFVDFGSLMVIDEVQRVPDLLLAVKERVDRDSQPGQYLLTGSARVLGLRDVPDTLAGRTETIELWPFSQGEIDAAPDNFVDVAFGDGEFGRTSGLPREEYARRVVRGGFPEAVARSDARRRERFLDSYVADLIARDVSQLSEIERPAQLRALLRLLAARSGQPLVGNSLASDLQISASTVRRYLGLLEDVFLIKRVPAWSRNVSTRAIGTPKVAFVDSGIAANLLDASTETLLRPGGPFGPLLEGFVLMELARQLSWSRLRVELSHYRTKDGTEVDAILEDRQGRVIGIEVKASSTPRAADFRGLKHIAARLGADFLGGLVLYTGSRTLSFGSRLRAVPVSALWESGSVI